MGLSWSAPSSGGGIPSSYSVQYRVSGTGTWSTASSSVSSTAFTASGLTASTSYDFQVFAVNAGGAGAPSSIVSASTSTSSSSVTSIAWNVAPSGSYTAGNGTIGVNAQVSPSTAAVQFGFSTSATVPPTFWTAATHVNTNLWGAYVPTPASAGTWFGWCEGTDGSAPTVYPTSFTVS
ncbi:MAG: fibronectin type III domain-containing protein [Acetobacteraceae bacterium]